MTREAKEGSRWIDPDEPGVVWELGITLSLFGRVPSVMLYRTDTGGRTGRVVLLEDLFSRYTEVPADAGSQSR